MRRLGILLLLLTSLSLAQGLEVGGELSRAGVRPYALLSWAIPLGERTWLIPSAFVYLDSLEASLERGWISLQLLREERGFSMGIETFWTFHHGPSLRLFLRLF